MAQTDTRPGFRLPWTGERTETDQQTPDNGAEPPPAAEGPEATEAPAAEYEAAAETAEEMVTPAMIETEPTVARKPNKFMAELSRAMQGAAETARNETLARFVNEAKAVIEAVHAAASEEAAALRRRADDDVAAVRDWSKAEIARIREETEARISARKSALDGEVDAHTRVIEARVQGVGASVADYETQMASFFERLMAEEDPTRIAALAETMPDPPSLADVAAAITTPPAAAFEQIPQLAAWSADPDFLAATQAAEAPVDPDAAVDAEAEVTPDFEAAEAEAASFTGDEEETPVAAPEVSVLADESPVETVAPAAEAAATGERATTRVVVVGLVSVASIATFKRSLGRVAGVSAIGVASGPDGEFVFTVSHDSSLDLRETIPGLAGFEARITAETTNGLEVAAHDPDAAD